MSISLLNILALVSLLARKLIEKKFNPLHLFVSHSLNSRPVFQETPREGSSNTGRLYLHRYSKNLALAKSVSNNGGRLYC